MKLYQFNVPDRTNNGLSYYAARKMWEEYLVDVAGGYTYQGVQSGAWRNDDGAIQREPMHVYQVATFAGDALQAKLFELFPDQHSFFVATIGDALLLERERQPREGLGDIEERAFAATV